MSAHESTSNGGHPKFELGGTKAVVLAGGRGTRLAPYTSVLPKPLMPIADRAILEIVVDQLESCGIVDISFCVGYLSHLIRAVFDSRVNGNGNVRIDYVQEQEPLGTAAPLHLVDGLDDTFLVMNGDVLTTLDYGDLIRHHKATENVLTIATHVRSITIDYGLLHLDVSSRVREFEEKPEIVSPVSMGIYVMEPDVLDYIPSDRHFDFPDLVKELLAAGRQVGAYRHDGLWFDIGRHEDYEQAALAWVENGHGKAESAPPVESRGNGTGPRTNGLPTSVEEFTQAHEKGSPSSADKEPRTSLGVTLQSFTEAFSQVPMPVSVVTSYKEDGQPHGTTVSAFSSLSVNPPLVLVALDRSSDLLALLQRTKRFGLNVLAAGQEQIGRACARKGPEKLAGLCWNDHGGLPRIDGVAAWLECEVEDVLPGGDHLIVLGLVTACETDETDPLVYHRRDFRKLSRRKAQG